MGAGKLNRRVTIVRPTNSRNSFGEVVKEPFSPVATVWAGVRWVTGREQLRGGAKTQTQTAIFRVRFRPGLEPRMWVRYRDQMYDIESIAEATEQRDRYLDLTATVREVATKVGATP